MKLPPNRMMLRLLATAMVIPLAAGCQSDQPSAVATDEPTFVEEQPATPGLGEESEPEPADSIVSFTANSATASGNDSLLTVIRAITTVPEGFEIVAVDFTSSDDAVIATPNGFAYNGVFLKDNATVSIDIDRLMLWDAEGDLTSYNYHGPAIEIGTSGFNTQEMADNFTEAKANIVNYFKTLQDIPTVVTAMHNKEPNSNPRRSTNEVLIRTGETPAIWSGDFLFGYGSQRRISRQRMIEEAIRQWNDGALINIMLHVCPPIFTAAQEEDPGCRWVVDPPDRRSPLSTLTLEEWESLTTDGGELNTNWKARLDVYAEFLQELKDAGVVPMFRPFHEQNQNLFWWSHTDDPANTTAKLFRLTHDYLVYEKGLDNMIWVWNMQDLTGPGLSPEYWDAYNPGDEYWDIMTLDVYEQGFDPDWPAPGLGSFYGRAVAMAQANTANGIDGKPFGIGECYIIPVPQQLARLDQTSFVMPWAIDALNQEANTEEIIYEFYAQNVTIEDLPTFRSPALVGSQ